MESICQTCLNFNCSWHKKFVPVKGWKAQETERIGHYGRNGKTTIIKSYHVEYCPQYETRHMDMRPIAIRQIKEDLEYGSEKTTQKYLFDPNKYPSRINEIYDYYKRLGYEICWQQCGKKRKYYLIKEN